MDYFKLFDDLDLHKLEEKVEDEIVIEDCCNNKEIVIADYNYVCSNCGIIQKTDYLVDVIDYDNPPQKIDVFNPNKSMTSWVGNIGYDNKYKALSRINKWMNYSSKDVEANKCYKLIEDMILLIIPNLKMNHCLGEKILNQSKLYWKALYYTDLEKSTRGTPRKCLFSFCIIKSLENYKVDFTLLDTLKKLEVKVIKYNEVLKTKITGQEKTFAHKQFNKYLEIINNYEPNITLDILIERYNINMKNKINKSKLPKNQRININKGTMLKAIAFDYIKNHITKQDACDDILTISFLTLNKAIKLIN